MISGYRGIAAEPGNGSVLERNAGAQTDGTHGPKLNLMHLSGGHPEWVGVFPQGTHRLLQNNVYKSPNNKQYFFTEN